MPDAATLTLVQRESQSLLRVLVEGAGGRFTSKTPIPADHVEELTKLFDEWAHAFGEPVEHGTRFRGRPGLWHALDDLYPLEDPNRWDRLRQAIIEKLEQRNWRRVEPPRGSVFDILE